MIGKQMATFANEKSLLFVVDKLEGMRKSVEVFQCDIEPLNSPGVLAAVDNRPGRSEMTVLIKAIAPQFKIGQTSQNFSL